MKEKKRREEAPVCKAAKKISKILAARFQFVFNGSGHQMLRHERQSGTGRAEVAGGGRSSAAVRAEVHGGRAGGWTAARGLSELKWR